jgi:hypothetical protein
LEIGISIRHGRKRSLLPRIKSGPRLTHYRIAEMDIRSLLFFENYNTLFTIMELLHTNSRPSGQVAACASLHTDFSSNRSAFLATLFTLRNLQCSVKDFLHSILDYFPSTLTTSKHSTIELSWIIIVGCRSHCSNDLNVNISAFRTHALISKPIFRNGSSRIFQVP